jgi:hypothetical protein
VHQNLEISILLSFTANASISDPDPNSGMLLDPNSGILLDPDPVFAESVLKPGGCRLKFLITENLRTDNVLLCTRIQKYRFYYSSYTLNTRDLDPDPNSGILLNLIRVRVQALLNTDSIRLLIQTQIFQTKT